MNSGRSVPSVSSTSSPLRCTFRSTIATCAGSVLPPGKRATRIRVVSCSVRGDSLSAATDEDKNQAGGHGE